MQSSQETDAQAESGIQAMGEQECSQDGNFWSISTDYGFPSV